MKKGSFKEKEAAKGKLLKRKLLKRSFLKKV
jgi:hypothetical protein